VTRVPRSRRNENACRNSRLILTFREDCWHLDCEPKNKTDAAIEKSSVMTHHVNDPKSETLELPASSLWIPRITLGLVIALA
jgi:hypothetical protein